MNKGAVLVTGGAGYAGSLVVRHLLDSGYDVRVLDRMVFSDRSIADLSSRMDIVEGDVATCPADVFDGVDAVVHLAAVSTDRTAQRNPRLTDLVNHVATERLAVLAKRAGVRRFVFASTCSLYYGYDTPLEPPVAREDDPINPIAVYAVSKRAAEEALLSLGRNGDLEVVILRHGTLFGTSRRMRYDLVVNTFVKDAFVDGQLTVDCGGQIWRPLADVADLGWIYRTALELPARFVASQIFNVCSENANIGALASRVCDFLTVTQGVDIRVKLHPFGFPRNYRADSSKLVQVFAYSPSRTLEDAVTEIWEELRALPSGEAQARIHYNDAWNDHLVSIGDPRALRLEDPE